jgi:hypothetical protein
MEPGWGVKQDAELLLAGPPQPSIAKAARLATPSMRLISNLRGGQQARLRTNHHQMSGFTTNK